jgi:hypothetical protein
MSHQERDGLKECLASWHGADLVDMKFFRGLRNDVITAEEICAQAHSAIMQHRMGTADVSREAPKSTHPSVDVREFVAKL